MRSHRIIPLRGWHRRCKLRRIRRRLAVGLVCGIAVFTLRIAGDILPAGPLAMAESPVRIIRGGDAWGGFSAAPEKRSIIGRTVSGRVTHVRDGDTIEVAGVPIRFERLDCAESGTLRGDRATRAMRALVASRQVTCRLTGKTSYDRKIGSCTLPGGEDLAARMVRSGYCRR